MRNPEIGRILMHSRGQSVWHVVKDICSESGRPQKILLETKYFSNKRKSEAERRMMGSQMDHSTYNLNREGYRAIYAIG